jgi:hypothetical protein
VDRAYRIGQMKNVVIYRLITCSTIEEKIYRKQIFKGSLSKIATQNEKQFRYFTKDELIELFTLKDPSTSETQIHLQKTHEGQRVTYEYLEQHIKVLKKMGIFGISDHDLLFKKEEEEIQLDIQLEDIKIIKNPEKKNEKRKVKESKINNEKYILPKIGKMMTKNGKEDDKLISKNEIIMNTKVPKKKREIIDLTDEMEEKKTERKIKLVDGDMKEIKDKDEEFEKLSRRISISLGITKPRILKKRSIIVIDLENDVLDDVIMNSPVRIKNKKNSQIVKENEKIENKNEKEIENEKIENEKIENEKIEKEKIKNEEKIENENEEEEEEEMVKIEGEKEIELIRKSMEYEKKGKMLLALKYLMDALEISHSTDPKLHAKIVQLSKKTGVN